MRHTQPPPDTIQFGGTICRLFTHIAPADPMYVSLFLAKVGLRDTYMHIWTRAKETPLISFFPPPQISNPEPLIWFHLSIPMGYDESTQLFCWAIKTVMNIMNYN